MNVFVALITVLEYIPRRRILGSKVWLLILYSSHFILFLADTTCFSRNNRLFLYLEIWVVQTVRWNNILKSSEHEAVLTDYRIKYICCVVIKWIVVLIEFCGRELLSNLEKVTCKINANICHITGVYLIAKFFLSLASCDTYHWFEQTELMCFYLPSFLNSYFWKKFGTVHFWGSINAYLRYECFFQQSICILAG